MFPSSLFHKLLIFLGQRFEHKLFPFFDFFPRWHRLIEKKEEGLPASRAPYTTEVHCTQQPAVSHFSFLPVCLSTARDCRTNWWRSRKSIHSPAHLAFSPYEGTPSFPRLWHCWSGMNTHQQVCGRALCLRNWDASYQDKIIATRSYSTNHPRPDSFRKE